MNEHLEEGHAELVPLEDLEKSPQEVFYLPMHTVKKESSTTTKVRAVLDISAKLSTGVCLNDTLLVEPTVYPPIIDVLLCFHLHLVNDVSHMYRTLDLVKPDRDLHWFMWRRNPKNPQLDYHMTRVTIGVSASSFTASMSITRMPLTLLWNIHWLLCR